MKLKNIDPGKIWAKLDHWFKSYGHFCFPFQHFDAGQSRVRKSSNIRRTLSLWVRSLANPRSQTNEDPYDQVIKFVKLPILLYSSKIWGCILFSTFNNDPQNESWHFLKIFMKNLEKLWKKYNFMKILELLWNKYKICKNFRKIIKFLLNYKIFIKTDGRTHYLICGALHSNKIFTLSR